MASTVTIDNGQTGRGGQGDVFVRRGTLNLGIYATGGVSVTKQQLELPVEVVDVDVQPSAGIIFETIKGTGGQTFTIKAYRQKDPAAAGGADIALPEVTNAVDLSAVVPRFEAKGR